MGALALAAWVGCAAAGSAQGNAPGASTSSGSTAAGDRRLDGAAPINGRAAQSVMLAAASVGPRLVVAGERGTIVFSDDCGARWTQAKVPVSVTLTALGFVDERQGWAVGHGGVVLASNDGGVSWNKQLDGRAIAQLALASARKAAAAGDAVAKRLLADAERLVADGADKPLFAAHFRDAKHAIVVGAFGLALTTEDGGASWQWIADRIPNPKGLHLYGLWAQDAQVVVVGEQGFMARSRDGGRTFESVATPYAGSYFGVAGATKTPGADLVIYGLRGTAYRVSAATQAFEPVTLSSRASVLGVLPQADGSSWLFDADGQIVVLGGRGGAAPSVASSPVGPVLGAAPACGSKVVLAGLRGIALVEPAALGSAALTGSTR